MNESLFRRLASSHARTLAFAWTCALGGLAGCGDPGSTSGIALAGPDPTEALDVDAGAPDEVTGDDKRICNWDSSCCCTRDRYGELRCYGSCQTP